MLMVEVVVMSYLSLSARVKPSKLHWNVGTGSASATQVKAALLPTCACMFTGGVVILAGTGQRKKIIKANQSWNITCK